MVELKECSDIMNAATSRSLVILDEIGRGTGTMDGVAIAYAVLSHFVTECKPLTLFITHYPMLSKIETLYPDMARNYHIGILRATRPRRRAGNHVFISFTKGGSPSIIWTERSTSG